MIVDTSNTLPTREMLFEDMFSGSEDMKLYFQLFSSAWAKWLNMSLQEFEVVAGKLSDKDFKEEIIKRAESGPMSMENFIKQLQDAGITHSAVHNMDEENATGYALPNDYVAEMLRKYPNQFIGFTGFNPHKGKRSLKEVERGLTELGLKAVVFRPYMHRLFADDQKYYPFANSTIQDKVLFGSDWVSMGMPIKDVLSEVNAWPLKPHVKEKLFWKNACRVFNLNKE